MKSSDMNSGRKGRGRSLSSREEALSCVPVKNREVVETRLESGEMVLEYPAALRPFLAGIMKRIGRKAPPVYTKRLQLDILGAAAWDLIDGKRSVGRLIKDFAEKFRLHSKEAETSVTQFIRELGRRGLIGLN